MGEIRVPIGAQLPGTDRSEISDYYEDGKGE